MDIKQLNETLSKVLNESTDINYIINCLAEYPEISFVEIDGTLGEIVQVYDDRPIEEIGEDDIYVDIETKDYEGKVHTVSYSLDDFKHKNKVTFYRLVEVRDI